MLLSTFELLLKPITPTPGMVPNSDRGILQGYFLNVANPNNVNLRLRLRYTALTPQINPAEVLAIRDTAGGNVFGGLVADGPNRFRYDFSLNAQDTGLVILQPNIRNLDPATANLEVRGYVEIFILVPFFGTPRSLLLTPEHRGTFLPSPNGTGEFDQLITSLPTSTGASLMEVDVISNFPHFPLQPVPLPAPVPAPGPAPLAPVEEVPVIDPVQVLNVMAQRIESLEQQLQTAAAE